MIVLEEIPFSEIISVLQRWFVQPHVPPVADNVMCEVGFAGILGDGFEDLREHPIPGFEFGFSSLTRTNRNVKSIHHIGDVVGESTGLEATTRRCRTIAYTSILPPRIICLPDQDQV